MMFEIENQRRRQIAPEQNNASRGPHALDESRQLLRIQRVAETGEVLLVLVERVPDVRRNVRIPGAACQHRIERSGIGDRQFVQVAAKFRVARKTHSANGTQRRGGVRPQPLRHRPDTQKQEAARIFQHGPDQLPSLKR